MRSEALRAKFDRGEVFVGTHCQIAEPVIPEIFGMQGFDFLWIDVEHSAIDRKELNLMIMAAHLTEAAVLVRIPCCDPVQAKAILEMGPDGIIFPNVRDASEARLAVAAVRYPPDGVRGYGPQRATGYGRIPTGEWVERESKKVWCIPQIEDYRAVEHLEEILAVPGIDALVCGPMDLSGSMGKLTQLSDPEVQRVFDAFVAKSKRAGVPVGASFGYGANGDDLIAEWLGRGVDFLSVGSDFNFLAAGAAAVFSKVRQACGEGR
ncbi:MAG: 4-hydroxy-3-methylbut-2-en-1-yl diphosphate synthase [Planctomycetes bacterium]|nr:4-hydroxy-3-methylbut-2-en-1-yl diphosphate synthase [Planctomycetota bacterium]